MNKPLLSPHFGRSEFACKCGCGFDTVDTELLRILENIRGYFDKPVYITSACRCIAHNEAEGGTNNSQHLKGRAADVIVKGVEPDDVAAFLETILLHGGVGRYSTFTHVDCRTNDYVAGWSGA